MPYFQRKPIEELIDTVRSIVPIPGLPSRGPAPGIRATAGSLPISPPAAITGIVEQATAVLASVRPRSSTGLSTGSRAGSVAPTQTTQISQLQEQVNELIGRVVALAAAPPGLGGRCAAVHDLSSRRRRLPAAADLVVEPAPVLSPPGPVAPGGTAHIRISLINEDEQPAQIVFFSTGLIGADGEQHPARTRFVPAAGADALSREDR